MIVAVMTVIYCVIILTEPDGTSNQYDNDNLSLLSTFQSQRNSRGFRDHPTVL